MKRTALSPFEKDDITTIYFNCFDTWIEIGDKSKSKWGLKLFETLNLSPQKTRDLLLTQNKSLREILQDIVPYVFNAPHKVTAIEEAEKMLQEEIASIQLKPGADTVLPELANRGYKLGTISNIAKAYIPKVLELAPVQFEYTLFSCELGYKKTLNENRIYQEAQNRSGQTKKHIVMIGDHPVNDYEVSDEYGFFPIHMDRNHMDRKGQRIYELEELLSLFPKK